MFILFVQKKVKELSNGYFYLDYDPEIYRSSAEMRAGDCLLSAWIYFSVKTKPGSDRIIEEIVVIDAYVHKDTYVGWAKEYNSLPHTRALTIIVVDALNPMDPTSPWSQGNSVVISSNKH